MEAHLKALQRLDNVTGPRRERRLASELRKWLGSGACRSESGAYVAWRDISTKEKAFEYPEITGYALTYLAARPILSEAEVAAAKRAMQWLRNRLRGGDLSARSGWDGSCAYAFDLGMVAHGLMMMGMRLCDAEATLAGRDLAELIAAHVGRDGLVQSLLPGIGTGSNRESWSVQGVVHLVKLTQCLLSAAELGAPSARSAAARLIEQSRAFEREEGRLETHPSEPTFVHPTLYACEGLWVWGAACSDRWAIARARRTAEWVWRHQLATGGLPRSVGGPIGPEQLDATAQAVRAALLLGLSPPGLQRAIARLHQQICVDGTGVAMAYQPGLPHQNVWTTMFAAQALEMTERGGSPLLWKELV